MPWAFRILAALNILLLAVTFLYRAPGEDAAGEGMRLGFGVAYVIALTIVLGLYALVRTLWVRVSLLAALTLPLISILYRVALSL